MSVLIDINTVCLICLKKKHDMRSIFCIDEKTQLTIKDKLQKCSKLDMQTDFQRMPDQICQRCADDLNIVWRFLNNVDEANRFFAQIREQSEKTTTIELIQQQIKLPTGLVIKKLEPQTETYFLLEENDEETIVETVLNEQTGILETKQDKDDEDQISEQLTKEIEAEEIIEERNEEAAMFEELKEEEVAIAEAEAYEEYFEYDVEENYEESFDEAEEKQSEAVKSETEELQSNEEEENVVTNTTINNTEDEEAAAEEDNTKACEYFTVIQELYGEPYDVEDEQKSDLKQLERSTHELNTKQSTNKHKRKNTVRPPKICHICGNSYKYQHALNAHMRRHNNDRPFGCEFCEKSFISGVELRRHLRVHTGQKPYPCTFCDRRFSDFGSRIKHERTHTGERPYQCNACNKCFAYAHVLSVHLRTHTGEKRFRCTICDRGFTKKAYLLTHLEHHQDVDGTLSMHVKSRRKTTQTSESYIKKDELLINQDDVENVAAIVKMETEPVYTEEELQNIVVEDYVISS